MPYNRDVAQRTRGGVPDETTDVERSLSFVNTLSGRAAAEPDEKLGSFEAFVAWAREHGVLKGGDAERLLARGKRRPSEAERVLADARALRELLHDALTAMAAGRAPAASTLDDLSERIGRWYQFGRLVPSGGVLQWTYAGDDTLDRLIWEVARAAVRLLTSSRLTRVRACAATDCGWWFLDETKNASRRWCDMKVCGNREKVRRFRGVHA